MTWRIAKSLEKLRSQINAEYPKRDKSSDGTIGDAAHASRSSDHNPWVKDGKTGVVTGMDITNDPKNGMASGDLAEALLASRDPRIKYVISNARICSGDAGPSPWVWRKYSGANAHRHHVHLSVKPEKKFYDSVKPWSIAVKPAKFVEPIATIEEPEEVESEAEVAQPAPIDIQTVQEDLIKIGYHEVGKSDGVFGPNTAKAIAAYKFDNKMPGAPVIDEDLAAAVAASAAKNECRLVPLDRATITAKELAPTVPAVRQTFRQRFWAFVGTVAAMVTAAINWISQQFDSVHEYVRPYMSYLKDVPLWLWLVGAAGVLLYFIISSNKVNESIADLKRTNRLN
jgi:hypothetical protein